MICSRILYGLSREGFFISSGTLINKGGTPYVVLIIKSLIGVAMVLIGSFEQLFALDAFYDNAREHFYVRYCYKASQI